MATIFRRGKNWHIAYYEDGNRVYESLKTEDAKIARQLKKEKEVQLAKGTHQREKRITIDAYYQKYLGDITYRKRSTNIADASRVREFLNHHEKRTINSINYDDVHAYLTRFDKHAEKTYNHVIGTLHRFFRLAVEQGYIRKNPVEGFRRKKVPQSLPRFLTDDEYLKIEKLSADEGIFSMVVTARYTGMRLSELLHLEWQDFDWERRLVRVLNKPKYGHTVKNFQVRVVPISDELRDKLLPYAREEGLCFPTPGGGIYNHEGPRRALRKVLAKSDIRENRKRIGWHEFRHTFASRLAQQGVSLYKICKWLGHSDIKVTQIYAHFAPVYDDDIEKLCIVGTVDKSLNF